MPATIAAMTAIFLTILKPTSGGAFGYAVVSAALLAVASSLWTRQHFTFLVREDDALVIRAMSASRRLRTGDIDRVRVVRLASVFHRPERRRLLPRPADRWLATDALTLRLGDGVDRRALSRLVGARCVIDDLLVVPVVDAGGLADELLQHVCPPRPAATGASRRRGRRR